MHHRYSKTIISAICLAGLFLATTGRGAEIEKVHFADQHKLGKTTLELHRTGLMRYRYVIKAFVAALYLGHDAKPEQALADVPKRLEIEYFYSLKGADIKSAAEKVLAANLTPAQLKSLKRQIDTMNALYVDVKPNDRYSLTYVPGVGTELALNGKTRGTVPGAEFAAAYFTIWLGEKPMDDSLKAQLLGSDKKK